MGKQNVDSDYRSVTEQSGTGDAEAGLTLILDRDAVQREIDAQVAITTEFGKQASRAAGDYAKQKEGQLRQQANQAEGAERDRLLREAESWGEGGANRVLMHSVIGGLGSGLSGALGAGTSAALTPVLAEQIVKLDVPLEVQMALIQATGAALGATVGGAPGSAAAVNEVTNNYLALIRSAQIAADAARLGVDKISGASAAVLQSCIANSACRQTVSNILPPAAIAWFVSQNTPSISVPSLVDQIPTGYGGGYRPEVGPSHTGNNNPSTPAPEGSSTILPIGQSQNDNSTGGAPISQPRPEDSVLPGSSSIPLPGIGVVLNENSGAESEKTPFPRINEAKGVDPVNIDKINSILSGASNTTTSATRNATQPSGTSIDADFDYLSQGNPSRVINTQFGPGRVTTLPDGSRIVLRPSSKSTQTPTIDVMRPDGNKVVEIRYPK